MEGRSPVRRRNEDVLRARFLGKPTGRKIRGDRPVFGSARCRARHFSRASRHRLRQFPGLPPNPTLHIASRPNEVILQFHFGQAPRACPPQTIAPHQLALRAFNPIALFHPLLEALGLLLLPPGLQERVVFAHHQRPVPLILAQALTAQGTIVTMEAELETVIDLAGGFLL